MLQLAQQRLDACADGATALPAAALPQLRDQAQRLLSALELPGRREVRDLVDDGVDLAFRVGREAEQRCGRPAAPVDRAFLVA
jgi:hypothetical protein